jgi:flagellar biosynthetic protein FliP
MKTLKKNKKLLIISFLLLVILFVPVILFGANTIPLPKISIGVTPTTKPNEISTTLQIIFLLTILTLAPSILIMMTSFTRIIIVLHFLRQALGTQQMPPNQILIGLALFLTFFIMSPVINDINQNALQPYLAEKITQQQALNNALKPIRKFMLKQTKKDDLKLFISLTNKKHKPKNIKDVSTLTIIPAFITSELKTAFEMGFLIYIPFLVLDMVVASVLLSMGMMMLPPIMVSLPFKIILFVLADGWNLLVNSLIKSFY